jgi:hypothetical protein
MTAAQIGRELMIATHQVHKALDPILPAVDSNYRRRAISESLVQIDTVIATHMRTIEGPESASIVIRGVCERRSLLGVTGSTDPVLLSQQSRPDENSMSAVKRGFRMIERMRQLAAEKPENKGSDTTVSGSRAVGALSDQAHTSSTD